MVCFVVMTFFLIFLPRYIKKNDDLYLRLNDRLEKEAKVIGAFSKSTLDRHYGVVSKFRIAISNREAMSYFIISLDDSPKLIEEFSNLKDIGKRIDAQKKDNNA